MVIKLKHLRHLGHKMPPRDIAKPSSSCLPMKVVSSATNASLRGEDRHVAIENVESRIPAPNSIGATSPISMFMVLDGHNGDACVQHTEREFPQNFMAELAREGEHNGPDDAIIRALFHAFRKTDEDFSRQQVMSGSTATVVVVDGSRVTIGNVGDSECLLLVDTGAVPVTVSHRLNHNPHEILRLKRAGAAVCKFEVDGNPVGPMRLWPGGISVGRAFGDVDVGPSLLSEPDVMQFDVPPQGARLIIASDGLWDSLSKQEVARLCRKVPTRLCPDHLVKSAIARRGLKDDITVMVVDLFPWSPGPPPVNACPITHKRGFFQKLRRTRLMDPLVYLPTARHSRIGVEGPVGDSASPSTRRIVTVKNTGAVVGNMGTVDYKTVSDVTTYGGRLYEQLLGKQALAASLTRLMDRSGSRHTPIEGDSRRRSLDGTGHSLSL